jgi:GT2 family glycosyltransferase
VTAIVPGHNRRSDVELLLRDLAEIREPRIALHILLVDNASDQPLATLETPEGLSLEHLRLSTNTGGSGGFNAGLAYALHADAVAAQELPHFLLLIDSDARFPADTLGSLLAVLESDPTIVAAGPALADPATGRVFECGGHLNRRTGAMEPMVGGVAGVTGVAGKNSRRAGEQENRRAGAGQSPALLFSSSPVLPLSCDYLAACCALVRTDAAIAAGPFPDTFLNADDAEWFIRMAQITGGRIVAVPAARAFHPRFDRFPTWTRYYSTRNAHGPIAAVGAPWRTHLKRAFKDAARAAALELAHRHDLAKLHLKGLRDAARGRTRGPLPAPAPSVPSPAQAREVAERSKAGGGSPTPSAPTPLRHTTPSRSPFALLRATTTLTRGTLSALRIAARTHAGPSPLNPAVAAARARVSGDALALTLEAIVLSYNRWPALEQTITSLLDSPTFTHGTITIIDNGSTDNTPERVEAFLLPGNESRLRLIKLDDNLGIEAFNRAAMRSTADVLLILDDDAIPAPDAVDAALEILARNPDIPAIPLHPRHPKTDASEWPFAARPSALGTRHFPLLGCANLIRRSAWNAVGGYESAFFLYRNDVDLALKLLDSGRGVHFNPALVAFHDTPAAPGVAKSVRWHTLATRNWIWMARRHSGTALPGGVYLAFGVLLNWLWAHKLAGLSPKRHLATLRGVYQGLSTRAPAAPPSDGCAWQRLLRLHLSRL